MITDEQIADLRRLEQAATPGALRAERGNVGNHHPLFAVSDMAGDGVKLLNDGDTLLWVEARNAIRPLLDELERLRKIEAAAREHIYSGDSGMETHNDLLAALEGK